MPTHPDELLGFLGRRFAGQATDVEQLGFGQWSTAYGFRHRGREWVVRFSAYPDDFARDRLASAYASPMLPIPEVVEMGQVDGLSYAITPRLNGIFLEDLDSTSFEAALPSLLDAFDEMRQLAVGHGYGPWDADGKGAYPSWRRYLLDVSEDRPTQRTHGWRARLAELPEAAATFEAAYSELVDVTQQLPDIHELVHNDLLNRNVFVEDARVAGIIDWGSSLYGDVLYDVALTTFWAPWFPAITETAVLGAARERLASGTGSEFTTRVRAYRLHVGLVHIAYNAFLGDERAEDLVRVCRRIRDVGRL
jgi:hygromycin-B 4-O-kinase